MVMRAVAGGVICKAAVCAGVTPAGAPCACALCSRALSLAVDTIEKTASVIHTINVISVANTDIVDIAVDATAEVVRVVCSFVYLWFV